MIRISKERSASLGRPGVLVLVDRSAPRQQKPAFEGDRDALDHLDTRAAGLDGVAIGKRSPQPGGREGNGNRNIDKHLMGKAETIAPLWHNNVVRQ
ncbi:MAG TPA: hypothetical protein VF503_26815 [Sphingobium sp.]|uniref:hypothetical protein n=1 Tax=Sphingobium sp. TaxID=1912891 RepID=UPI0010017C46|nr:hypothetical protein CA235_14000 [Sphingomonas sp. ABOLF]